MTDRLAPGDQTPSPAGRVSAGLLGRLGPGFAATLLAALLAAGLLGFDLWRRHGEMELQAFRETRTLARIFEAHLQRDIGALDAMLLAYAARLKARDAEGTLQPDEIEAEARLLQQSLSTTGVVFIDPDGRLISSTQGLTRGADFSRASFVRRWLDGPVGGEAFIAPLQRSSATGQWIVPMTRAVYRTDGSMIGIVGASMLPSDLVAPFAELDRDRFTVVTLFQRDGTIIARAPGGEQLVGQSVARGELFTRFLPRAAEDSVRYRGLLFGRELVMSYRLAPGTPFVLAASFDGSEILRPWYRLAGIYLVLGLALSIAVGFCSLLIGRDLSRRRALEAARHVQTIIDSMQSAVLLLTLEGEIVEINSSPLARAGFRREDVIGRPLWQTSWFSYANSAQVALRSIVRRAAAGEAVRQDLMARVGDGFRMFDATMQRVARPDGQIYIVISGIDVTEHRQIEEQLRQSQKMEALGLLAGGIAHDFNNLLGSIGHFAQFLSEDLARQSAQHDFALRIAKACREGRQMVAQILTYARPELGDRTVIDLEELVEEVRELVQAGKPENCVFECALSVDHATAFVACRAQLLQILLNLCLNAVDALEGDLGVVRLAVEQARPDDPLHPLRPPGLEIAASRYRSRAAAPGTAYLRISVRDTGGGIAPEMLQRIFDPFFTTKPRGRGTGLGLAVVHSIVAALDGIVEVESTPGEGAVFAIYLPLDRTPAAAARPSAAVPGSARGHERVLIVEDDTELADGMAIGLERAGYEVAVVDCAAEALAALRDAPHDWKIVITDQNLPGLTGLELIREIKSMQPGLPTILHTGNADRLGEERARAQGADAFVEKPVEPAQLARAVRELLDRAPVAVPSPSIDQI